MHLTPITIFGLALFAYAFTRIPEKYRPAWTLRLDSWRSLLGVVAIVMAILIVLSPEIYALGLLGDSAFFDILVLALTCHLQVYGSRAGEFARKAFSRILRFTHWWLAGTCLALALMFDPAVSAIRKLTYHLFS